MNWIQYIMCSDTSQDYLRKKYSDRNGSAKRELNRYDT